MRLCGWRQLCGGFKSSRHGLFGIQKVGGGYFLVTVLGARGIARRGISSVVDFEFITAYLSYITCLFDSSDFHQGAECWDNYFFSQLMKGYKCCWTIHGRPVSISGRGIYRPMYKWSSVNDHREWKQPLLQAIMSAGLCTQSSVLRMLDDPNFGKDIGFRKDCRFLWHTLEGASRNNWQPESQQGENYSLNIVWALPVFSIMMYIHK